MENKEDNTDFVYSLFTVQYILRWDLVIGMFLRLIKRLKKKNERKSAFTFTSLSGSFVFNADYVLAC